MIRGQLLLGVQEVESSNLSAPTIYSILNDLEAGLGPAASKAKEVNCPHQR